MTGENPIRLAVDPKWVKKLKDIATVTTEMTKVSEERTKEVTTIIKVSCEGEMRRRVVHVGWWKELSIDDIADTTAKIVKEIVGHGELEEGTI